MALCEWCEKEIPKEKSVNLFCDLKCYHEWNASFKTKLECEICKKTYFLPSERAKISNCCSKSCRAQKAGQYAKAAHLGKGDITLKCDNCLIEFVTKKNKRIGKKVYCCKKCQHEHYEKSKVYINCKFCGNKKQIKPYQLSTAKYCSQDCKAKDLIGRCGKDHPSYKHGFRTYRKDALNHYKYTCKSCGKIDRRLHVHHIDGNNKNNIPSNWMILCPLCHRRIHLGKLPLPQDS